MSLLTRLLSKKPAVVSEDDRDALQQSELVSSLPQCEQLSAPPYGHRKNWVPRAAEDFGDGGSFPEIAVAQFPLGMGSQQKSVAIATRSNPQRNPEKIVYSHYTDLLPRQVRTEDDSEFARPDDEEVAKVTARTKQELERMISGKVKAAMPVQYAPKQPSAQFIRYTPASSQIANGVQQRIIRIVSAQKDPMEPPKFKINAKIPRGPPSPPVPVLHSPTRKVTMKEQQEWKVPPCISNWKNPKGYTIPLDKRLAADGRGLQNVHINEGFAKLAEALYVADREAREAIELRSQVERKLAQKEKDKKEDELRKLADQARMMRSTEGKSLGHGGDSDFVEREEIRKERQKDRQRQRAIQRAAPDKRTKLMKERERDITETIALGLPNRGAAAAAGGDFDTRLMDMSKGLDSGFAADDAYGVYDKPWREETLLAQTIYRPSKNVEAEVFGDDLEKLANARQFVGGSEAATKQPSAAGPVVFEKHKPEQKPEKRPTAEEEDPFGLGQFFEQVKRTNEDAKSSSKRQKRS